MSASRKSDENLDFVADEKNDNFTEEPLLGYNFLRNIWSTYLPEEQDISNEDRVDHINKIVGLMKERIKTMTTYQSNIIEKKLCISTEEDHQIQSSYFLQIELEKTKEALQRSKMKNQQFQQQLSKKQTLLLNLLNKNNGLKSQLSQLKKSKNRSQEMIIELSKKIYDLQRNHINTSDENNTLDQFSAISMSDSKEKPRIQRNRRQIICRQFDRNFNDTIFRSQQNTDPQYIQQLRQFDTNLPTKNRYSMNNLLQFHAKDNICQHHNTFLEEMKKMKQKSERFLQIENDKLYNGCRRKTFQPSTQRPNLMAINKISKERRFRRIR